MSEEFATVQVQEGQNEYPKVMEPVSFQQSLMG